MKRRLKKKRQQDSPGQSTAVELHRLVLDDLDPLLAVVAQQVLQDFAHLLLVVVRVLAGRHVPVCAQLVR